MVDEGEVLAEVAACFEAYDAALLANDAAALDGWFWESDEAIRYGVTEELYGHKAIAAHRRSSAGVVVRGPFSHRSISTFGPDAATVCAEFDGGEGIGRQTQTWIRMPDGWRIVCAHVSIRAVDDRRAPHDEE
jgi:hypothetical protein